MNRKMKGHRTLQQLVLDIHHPSKQRERARRRTRHAVAMSLGVLALTMGTLASGAGASPAGRAAAASATANVGNYAAGADGALLSVTAVSAAPGSPFAALPTVANLRLTHAETLANSAGPVNGDAALRTSARAANLDPLAVLGQINLSNVLSQVSQTAPPDNSAPATKQLLAVPANPVATASVSDASALARWAGDGVCVAADTPLAQSVNRTAQIDVLPGLPAPVSGSLLSINANQQGASFTRSTLSLPSITDPSKIDPRAVRAEQVTHAAGISLFGVNVDVSAVDPVLTATATGNPGGATVSYKAPIVTVNGNQVIGQSDISGVIASLNPVLAPVFSGLTQLLKVELIVPTEAQVVAGATLSADGTTASVDSVIARVRLTLTPVNLVLADVALGPMHAEAHAPTGGIDCGTPNPVRVVKDAPATVTAGQTFTQTITVSNVDPACTLSNVKVTDNLTGPDGSTVVGTDPKADSTTWPTVVWNNIGDIPPGGSRTLSVQIKVPLGVSSGRYTDRAVAEGDCNGSHFTGEGLLARPEVVVGLLPRTGRDAGLPIAAGALLVLGALGLRRLRRA